MKIINHTKKKKEKNPISLQWVALETAMLLDRGFTAMPPSALKIYVLIKMHVCYQTGVAFPSIKRIAELAGLSFSQVQRGIKYLESTSYLSTKRDGRNNKYFIWERVTICDTHTQPTHIVSWVFIPDSQGAARAELKRLREGGTQGNFQYLRIEKIHMKESREAKLQWLDAEKIKRELDESPMLMNQILARIYKSMETKEGE